MTEPRDTPISCEVGTLQDDSGQVKELTDALNERYDLAEANNQPALKKLDEVTIPLLCERYEVGESELESNPPFKRRTMRAATHSARGRYDLAFEYDLDAWEWAKRNPKGQQEDEQRRFMSIAASNVSDDLRRLQRYKDAVVWAERSCKLWDNNPVNYLVLGLALYRIGKLELADKVFNQLREIAAGQDGSHKLAFCLSYERELAEMSDLPSVRILLADFQQESRQAS